MGFKLAFDLLKAITSFSPEQFVSCFGPGCWGGFAWMRFYTDPVRRTSPEKRVMSKWVLFKGNLMQKTWPRSLQ